MMSRLVYTAFVTSLISYAVFGFAEYARPGFVSYVFSLHWFLLFVLMFGGWVLLLSAPFRKEKRPVRYLVSAWVSIALFLVIFTKTGVFGDLRGLFALIAATVPWALPVLLKSPEKVDNV